MVCLLKFFVVFNFLIITSISVKTTSSKTYIIDKLKETKEKLAIAFMQKTKLISAESNNKFDEIWDCFSILHQMLKSRLSVIEQLKNNWSKLLPISSNTIESTPLHLSKVSVQEGNISVFEFIQQEKLKEFNLQHIIIHYDKFEKSINPILRVTKNQILSENKMNIISGNVIVNKNAYFENLHIDYLNIIFFNGQMFDADKFLISEKNQTFSKPLQIKNIFIENLEVPSLCGLPVNNWQLINNIDQTKISELHLNNVIIKNDTILIEKNAWLRELNVMSINDMNLIDFLKNSFILGRNQQINGNINYKGLVQVSKLTANKVNNDFAINLITKNTKQNLKEVFIESLEVKHLFVNKINGVDVNKAARMSTENVIKGKVTVGNFIFTKELVVKENITLPFTHSTQVYDEIVINGDIYVKVLELEDDTTLTIGNNDGLKTINVDNILKDSWSKSRNQIIASSTIFERGAVIDKLYCQFLNGFSQQDFLYTNDYEFNNLENITFAHFHFDKITSDSSGIAENFFEESPDLVTFLKPIRFSHLSVDNIIVDSYNNIPIETLMQTNYSLKFSGISEFEAVRVNDQMLIEDFRINQLNKNTVAIHKALRINDSLQIHELKANNISIKNLLIKNLCNKNLEKSLIIQTSLKGYPKNISLTIDGEIEIATNLDVDKINNNDASDYVEMLKDVNLIELIDARNITNLRIVENLTIGSLNYHNVHDIFTAILSKTYEQDLKVDFTTVHANVKYLTTESINQKKVVNLMFINNPSVFYGNATFSELSIQGNIITGTLKGQDILKILEKQRVLPMKDIKSLHIFGNMSWNNPSPVLRSIDHLLNYAVTKHENQLISTLISFQESVKIDSLHIYNKQSPILHKIQDIIHDAVGRVDTLDDGSIYIKGTKIFKKGLVVSDLEIDHNLDIKNINDLKFDKVISEIYQKYNNESITAQVTFLSEVEIGTLITKNNIHGVSLHDIATVDSLFSTYLHFQNLVVQGNITLDRLDSVEFNNFKDKRIKIDMDYEIFGNIEFNDSITILSSCNVSLVNGIRPTDLVLNEISDTPNVIHDSKVFSSKLVVEGCLESELINNQNIREIYNKTLRDTDDVIIFGNLVFESNVDTLNNINISGNLNGLSIQHILQTQNLEKDSISKALNVGESFIENSISCSANMSMRSAQYILYLEEEDELNFGIPALHRVQKMSYKSATRLDAYATESGIFCRLESNCFCRRQYLIEITPSGTFTIHRRNNSNIIFSFYEPDNKHALEIVSSVVSSSELCSSTESENSKIFWTTFNNHMEPKSQNQIEEVGGFISDVQSFLLNGNRYLILAIFYNKATHSHETPSLVYRFNLQNKEINLIQPILTDGARSIHIFQIIKTGIYALIGCVKGKAESLLLQFDPNKQRFQLVRTFATGGSKLIASISKNDKNFIILNNPDIEALQIFEYDSYSGNFNEYQNLYFQSRVTSLNVFYSAEFGNSEVLIATTTKEGWFYVYEYMLYGKFQRKISFWQEDIQVLSSFRHVNQNYLFISFKQNSTILKIVQQGQ